MKARNLFFTVLLVGMASVKCFAQQQGMGLSVLLLPSDSWMSENGFVEKKTEDGMTHDVIKYEAVSNHRDMTILLGYVSRLFQERGFRVKSTEVYQPQETDDIWDELRRSDSDFSVDISYSVKQEGTKKRIIWELTATDVVTYYQVAAVKDTLETSDPLTLSIRKGLMAKSDFFFNQLSKYITDLQENGRKVSILLRQGKGSSINFATDTVNGESMKNYLWNLFSIHAVDGKSKIGRVTSRLLEIKQLRIPFYNEQGEVNDAEHWIDGIIGELNADSDLKFERSKNDRHNKPTLTISR